MPGQDTELSAAQHMLAREQICILKARYFRFVDQKRWLELRALFTDDATMHFAERTEQPEPADVAIARIKAVLVPDVVSVHHGHMPEIEIEGPDIARAIWAMEDRLVFPSGRPNIVRADRLRGYGHYHETYRREQGGWRIATMRLERLLVETGAASA